MQNTILIHAPGRRQGRGALVLAYTALFALLMGVWAAIFALNGQSFIQYGDTLKQHYPFLVYYGRWLRQAARCVLTGAAVGAIAAGILPMVSWPVGLIAGAAYVLYRRVRS